MQRIRRNGFTLIELLVVVAIIGILAAVGTPIFQGFLLDAKINSSRENHIRMRDYIATSFTKCAGSPDGKIQLGSKRHRCDGNTYSMARDFYDYFRGEAGFENPYDESNLAVVVANDPTVKGQTSIIGVTSPSNYIKIKTNIGDADSNNKYLLDNIIRE
ncbi:MAG: type II secretion system protein [Bacteroidetes bacterium]|nr:type II secretion system protein [Bacteroidota bacterium]